MNQQASTSWASAGHVRRSILLIALLAALLGACQGQAAEQIVYKGVVYDQSSAKPVTNATVSLSHGGAAYSAATDSDGGYIFVLPPTGQTAAITVAAPGYAEYYSSTISIADPNQRILLNPLAEARAEPTAAPATPTPAATATPAPTPTLGPAAPPKGRFAFVSLRDWDGISSSEIYTINADGSDIRRLTAVGGQTYNVSPQWSPDGSLIAFVGSQDIYIVNADGSGGSNLTRTPDIAETEPAWSPDGQRIVYIVLGLGMGQSTDIYVMNSDGSGQTLLLGGLDYPSQPDWSPDGKKIAFADYDKDGDRAIFVVDADGTNLTRLTPENARVSANHPQWSPDGKQILFSSTSGNYGAFIIDADGANLTRLVAEDIASSHPIWSPDGRQIAYLVANDLDTETDLMELVVIDAGGSLPTVVYSETISNAYSPLVEPDWR